MRIIVQKFGGTSVATPDQRQLLVGHVEEALAGGLRPVVVVSAMGRAGAPYATDTLLGLAHEACPDMPARELDLLATCGEVIATVVVTGTLRSRGLPAIALTGGQAGIVTDGHHGDAAILRVDTDRILRHLKEGSVVVVAGFQGVTAQGEISTLGRGGSDTTATALGGALRAEVVEIYTDVDGVKTADPRIVPAARTISVSTYDEIAQMAIFGARVIHPRAVDIAMQRSVPIRVKATGSDGPGTLITYSYDAPGAWSEGRRTQPVTGVTHIPHLCQVQLACEANDPRGTQLFRALADAGISVDLINVSLGQRGFCIDEQQAPRAEAVLKDLGLSPVMRTGCAKVSVVGAGMRGRPGVMATVAESLAGAGVTVLQSGDSHVTISCLVAAEQMEVAVRALHEGFGLGKNG